MDDEASLEFPPIAWRYPGLVGLLNSATLLVLPTVTWVL